MKYVDIIMFFITYVLSSLKTTAANMKDYVAADSQSVYVVHGIG